MYVYKLSNLEKEGVGVPVTTTARGRQTPLFTVLGLAKKKKLRTSRRHVVRADDDIISSGTVQQLSKTSGSYNERY